MAVFLPRGVLAEPPSGSLKRNASLPAESLVVIILRLWLSAFSIAFGFGWHDYTPCFPHNKQKLTNCELGIRLDSDPYGEKISVPTPSLSVLRTQTYVAILG